MSESMSPAGRWESISNTGVFTGVQTKKNKNPEKQKSPHWLLFSISVALIIGAKIQEWLN